MRFDRLFADLSGQLDAAEADELAAEIADRTRRERSLVAFADRLRGAVGESIELSVTGVGWLGIELRRVAADCVVGTTPAGASAVVALAATTAVRGLSPRSMPPAGAVGDRLGLGFSLRELVRDRVDVTIALRDRTSYVGRLEQVGADYLELSEPRRVLVPLRGLAVVRVGV